MRALLKYIFIGLSVLCISSCIKDDMGNDRRSEYIEFIVRPTGFDKVEVSEADTKALTETELTAVESAIYSLYFIVFGSDGKRIDGLSKENLVSASNPTPSQTLLHDYGKGPLTVCYLANVPKTYAQSIQEISDLSDKPLSLTYATYEETGYFGIPVIDDKQCFPMFGMVTYPGVAASDNKVIIPLERLFAKVVVNMKADMSSSIYNNNPPSIILESCSLTNLPKKVRLARSLDKEIDDIIAESAWAKEPDSFVSPESYDPQLEIKDGWLNGTNDFSKIVTCYIPEYALIPKEYNDTDQRIKPTLIDKDKHPVYLTLAGVAKQDNFVDVPVEYHIHFGEDAYDNFSLRRNRLYNNNITIKGTAEAVIGTDNRVDATYFNLADPDRTGTENPANCYIISKPGRYLIPTYLGNNTAGGTHAGTTAELFRLNGTNTRSKEEVTLNEDSGRNYVQFDVNMYNTDGTTLNPTAVSGGNHLLVLKNGNDVVWSWHLWMCEDESRPDKEDFQHTYPGTEAIVMNRALGATTNIGIQQNLPLIGAINLTQWTDGFYYQWGRKDPMMPQTAQSNGSYAASIQNPRVFYSDWDADGAGWSTDSKTVNDPCPPGYKVPSNQIWRESESTSTGMEDIMEGLSNYISSFDGYPYNLGVGLDISLNIVYPYKSYLVHSSGQLMPETNEEVHVTTSSWITDQTSIGTTQYRSSDFYLSYRNRPSFIWSANMETALNYSKRADNNSVRFVTGETRKYSWFQWSDWSSYNNQTISGNMVTDNFYNANPSKSLYSREYTELSPADGLMVRCVSENSPVQ